MSDDLNLHDLHKAYLEPVAAVAPEVESLTGLILQLHEFALQLKHDMSTAPGGDPAEYTKMAAYLLSWAGICQGLGAAAGGLQPGAKVQDHLAALEALLGVGLTVVQQLREGKAFTRAAQAPLPAHKRSPQGRPWPGRRR